MLKMIPVRQKFPTFPPVDVRAELRKSFRPQVCSLADYAGQNVLLAFRTFDDPEALGADGGTPPGFWIDDVRVGGALISDNTSLTG